MRAAAFLAVCAAAVLAAGEAEAQVNLSGSAGAYDLNVVSYRDIPFRSVVRQRYDFSCGSAALATLLRFHYGRDVDEKQVFAAMYEVGDQAQIQRVGFSLLDMKRYLETHGYQSDGFRMSLDDLAVGGSPAVVMVNHDGYRHFVVLKGIDGDRVLVGDPALGLKTYSREEFLAMWNGVAFLIHDPSGQYNDAGDWRPRTQAPMQGALPRDSLASLTRDLPPLYQITTTFSLDAYLR